MFGQLLKSVTNLGVDALWQQHGQQIQSLVVQQLVKVAEDKLNQEDELRALVNQAYGMLPQNITALLPSDVIVSKILENKEVILSQVQKLRTQA